MPCNQRPILKNARPLTLASASPRRAELLRSLGLDFSICAARIDEPPPAPGEPAKSYAIRAARTKAHDVAPCVPPDSALLAADTVVVLDAVPDADEDENERILGKPADEAQALDMLTQLSGRWHRVITGCCLLGPKTPEGRREDAFAVETAVHMQAWDEAMLAAYVATGEPMDKAGAYGIQGRGAFLVAEVRGSYTNVVGLPLAEVVKVLVNWAVAVTQKT